MNNVPYKNPNKPTSKEMEKSFITNRFVFSRGIGTLSESVV